MFKSNSLITFFVFLLLTLSLTSCAKEHDLRLVGKWAATGIQVNKWDVGELPSGADRIIEFYDDGSGLMNYKFKDYGFSWSTFNNKLVLNLVNGNRHNLLFTIKTNRITLDFEKEGLYVFEKR